MHLITDYPWYFILFCLLAGAVYAALLYWLPRRKEPLERKLAIGLTALRFLVVSIIAYLLLAPLVKHQRNEQEKPIILVAQDNSRSVVMTEDSSFYQSEYATEMNRLINTLGKDYDVHPFLYGSSIQTGDAPDYKERATDISQVLLDLEQRYKNRNVGALILSGDGIFNAGQNPSTLPPLPYPIYTVALGDTTLRRDAAIVSLRFNRLAYLGNQFPVEAIVRATSLDGQRQRLTVRHKGREVFSQTIDYQGADFSTSLPIVLNADEAGLQAYTVTLSLSQGETSTKNNTRTFTIEVIDGHQKIALLAATPHPDIAALRQSIEKNQNYEVETFVGSEWQQGTHHWDKDYDLLILHNLPQRGVPFDINLSKMPVFFVVGSQTDLSRFNAFHAGVEIVSKLEKQSEATAAFNKNFANFTIDASVSAVLEQLPPLSAPFGDYKVAGNTASLFNAKIGGIVSEQPLLAFSQQQGIRRAFLFGEGLWRWRLHDYLDNGSHEAFSQIIDKILIYTSLQVNRERFRVDAKSVYSDNEAVIIDAELYDDNFEPTNQPDAELSLNGAQYTFAKSGSGYRLNLGLLDTGIHRYVASVVYGGQKHTTSGRFVVEGVNLEESSLVARHALLNTLSQRSGGVLLYPSQLNQLPEILHQRDDIKPVIYSHTSYDELFNLPLILILILLLLTTEWVLRKYNGEL